MTSTRTTYRRYAEASHREARDARARAWAYVFSCRHAKHKDMPPQTAVDQSSDNAAKEVSHVKDSSDEVSTIVNHPLTKENE